MLRRDWWPFVAHNTPAPSNFERCAELIVGQLPEQPGLKKVAAEIVAALQMVHSRTLDTRLAEIDRTLAVN